MSLYDEVEYPSRAFSQTHPERAAAIGTILGLTPPSPPTCRVLEVGCGSGWNLIPMAAAMPEARFYGFDLAGSAIAAAQRDAAALGLSNLRFEALDIMDFPADAGEFDYIIAHGFYSWVPQAVRLKLLAVCQEHLAPQGFAFISYNAFPYAHMRRMWREMMLYHIAQTKAVTPAEQLAEAERLLSVLREQWSLKQPLAHQGALLAHQLEAIRQGGGNWFFHDDLGPMFEPLTVQQFSAELAGHGLQYASEALFEQMNCDNMPVALVEAAQGDWLAREQYLDNYIMRGFRMSLVCRSGLALDRPPGRAAAPFERLYYSAPLVRTGRKVFRNESTKSEAETEDPAIITILDRLSAAWPNSVSFDDLRATPEALWQLIVSNVVEPSVTPRRLQRPSHAAIWAPARIQARRGKVVTNRLHGAIQLEQEPLRQLVAEGDVSEASSRDRDWLYRAALLA